MTRHEGRSREKAMMKEIELAWGRLHLGEDEGGGGGGTTGSSSMGGGNSGSNVASK